MLKVLSDGWKNVLKNSYASGLPKEDWIIVNDPNVLIDLKKLPLELRYLIYLRPSRQDRVRELLESGFTLGLATNKALPFAVRQSVNNIAHTTQRGLIMPWLEKAILHGQYPEWSELEAEQAAKQGIDLKHELEIVKNYRENHRRLKIIAEPGKDYSFLDTSVIEEMNLDLMPLSIHFAWSKLRQFFDPLRLPMFLFLIVACLIAIVSFFVSQLYPMATVSLLVILTNGFLFSRDYWLNNKTAKVTWHKRNQFTGIMVIIFAVVASLMIYPLISYGNFFAGGVLLGLSVFGYRLYQIIRHIKKMSNEQADLLRIGKIKLDNSSFLKYLIQQERFAMLRIYILAAGLVISGLLIWVYPLVLYNGILIALLVFLVLFTSESVAWLDIKLNVMLYKRSLNRLWRKVIVLTSDAW